MEDTELGRRLGGIRKAIEELQNDVDKLRESVNEMQLADAEARADAKIVASELRVAATALANTAQAIQKSELARDIAGKGEDETRSERILRYAFITVGVLGAIAIIGERVLPVALKAFGLNAN